MQAKGNERSEVPGRNEQRAKKIEKLFNINYNLNDNMQNQQDTEDKSGETLNLTVSNQQKLDFVYESLKNFSLEISDEIKKQDLLLRPISRGSRTEIKKEVGCRCNIS